MAGLVLVPLDGSSLAARALTYAVTIARDRQLPLLLVRVLEPTPSRGMPLVQEPEARSYLERIADQLREEGIEIQTLVSSTMFGTVPEVLVAKAQQRGSDLIVMSTHGRSGLGRWVYGTVAEEVLRRSPVPVLLIPSTCDRSWRPGKRLRVLLPLDGSQLSEEVVQPMLLSIGRLISEIVVLQVEPSTALEAVYLPDRSHSMIGGIEHYQEHVARLQEQGLEVTALTEEGSPGAVISRVAAEQAVDLIAMATHGRSGVEQLVLGSVSSETLHRCQVPVLLYRPAAMRREPTHADIGPEVQALLAGHIQNHERLTVLVAIDLTDKANAALVPVGMLARAANARVILLNVFLPSVHMGHVTAGTQEERIEYVLRERRLYLAEKARALEGLDVTTRVEVQAHGEEVDECIARVAAEVQADVLVVVSKHVSGGASAVLGSFAQGILRLSPCPVLVVRPGAESRYLPTAGAVARHGSRIASSATSDSANSQR